MVTDIELFQISKMQYIQMFDFPNKIMIKMMIKHDKKNSNLMKLI